MALSTLFLPSPLECYYFFNYSYTTLRTTHTANSCSSGGPCPRTPAGPCRPPPPPSPSPPPPPPPCSRLLLLWTMERRAECRERPALLRSCDFSLGSSSHAQNISLTRYIPLIGAGLVKKIRYRLHYSLLRPDAAGMWDHAT